MAPRSAPVLAKDAAVSKDAPLPNSEGVATAEADVLADVEHALTRMMRQATRPALYRAMVAAAGTTLDRADYTVMLRIAESAPVRLTDIADVLGLDISTVSRQVRALERNGLVERSGDPDDQRASRLRLTAEGDSVLTRVRAARRENMRALLAAWSRDDQIRLARLVGRLADEMEAITP